MPQPPEKTAEQVFVEALTQLQITGAVTVDVMDAAEMGHIGVVTASARWP